MENFPQSAINIVSCSEELNIDQYEMIAKELMNSNNSRNDDHLHFKLTN